MTLKTHFIFLVLPIISVLAPLTANTKNYTIDDVSSALARIEENKNLVLQNSVGIKGEALRSLLFELITSLEYKPYKNKSKEMRDAFIRNFAGFVVLLEVLKDPKKSDTYLGFEIPLDDFHDLIANSNYKNLVSAIPENTNKTLYNTFFNNFFIECCATKLETALTKQITQFDPSKHSSIEEFLEKFNLGGMEAKRKLIEDLIQVYYSKSMPLKMKKRILKGLLSVKLSDQLLKDRIDLGKRRMAGVIAYSGPFMNKMFQQIGEEIKEESLKKIMRGIKFNLPSMDMEEVILIIKSRVAQRHIFDYKSVKLIGAASIGQAALIKDNKSREFVIKLIKPDVREQLAWEKKLFEQINLSEVETDLISKMFESFMEETDLRIEAQNTLEGARLYRNTKVGIDTVKLPLPHLNSQDMMIMTKAPGKTIGDFQTGRDLIVRARIFAEFYKKWLEVAIFDGFFHADPHTGNIFLSAKEPATLTVLDFGATAELTGPEMWAAKWFGMGIELKLPLAVYEGFRILTNFEVDQKKEFKNELIAAFLHTDQDKLYQALLELMERHEIILPKSFVLFFRADDYFRKQFKEINRLLGPHNAHHIHPFYEKIKGVISGIKNNPLKGAKDIVCIAGVTCSMAWEYFSEW